MQLLAFDDNNEILTTSAGTNFRKSFRLANEENMMRSIVSSALLSSFLLLVICSQAGAQPANQARLDKIIDDFQFIDVEPLPNQKSPDGRPVVRVQAMLPNGGGLVVKEHRFKYVLKH